MTNFYYVNIVKTIWLYHGDNQINLNITVGIENEHTYCNIQIYSNYINLIVAQCLFIKKNTINILLLCFKGTLLFFMKNNNI